MSPIQAINGARENDNKKTGDEFANRYKLIEKQMEDRNAPIEQVQQLQKVNDRFKNI